MGKLGLFALFLSIASLNQGQASCPAANQDLGCMNCNACSETTTAYAFDQPCSHFFWQCLNNPDGSRRGVCVKCASNLVWVRVPGGNQNGQCDYNCPTTTAAPTTTTTTLPTTSTPSIPTYSTCGSHVDVTLSGSNQLLLQSPNFPNHYPNNISCVWHLHAHSSGYNSVSIHSLAFDLETRYDYLTISDFYSGQLYGNYTGSAIQGHTPVIVNLNLARGDYRFQLHTDRSVSRNGFSLFISGSSASPPSTSPPTTPAPTFSKVNCSSTFRSAYLYANGNGLNLQSPNYNQTYSNSLDCGWTLVNRSPSSRSIQLRILDFNIERSYDNLYVKYPNGNILYRLSGSLAAGSVNASYTLPRGSTNYKLEFRTDHSVTRTGFNIHAILV